MPQFPVEKTVPVDAPDNHKRFLAQFLQNRDSLSAFIRVMVGNRELAEEILQETSLVLWEKFDTFREGTSFGAWSRQVALNVLRNARRREGRSPLLLPPGAAQAVADAFTRTETAGAQDDWRRALEKCLQRLPSSMGQVVELRYFRRLGLTDIASKLGRTAAGVNAALCKARHVLEACLRRSFGKNPEYGRLP